MEKLFFIFKRELNNLPNSPHLGEKKAELARLYKLIKVNDGSEELFDLLTVDEKQLVSNLFLQ